MQFSKNKVLVEYVKTFENKVYKTNIDLDGVNLKVFVIEEECDDVKVVYEGYKDLISEVVFDIVSDTLNIRIVCKEESGKIFESFFSFEDKLNIVFPTHFKEYMISGRDMNLRVNNLDVDKLNIEAVNGNIKVKYCDIKDNLSLKSSNAMFSLKSLELENEALIENNNGIIKLRDSHINTLLDLKTNSGIINVKNVKGSGKINVTTKSGSIDLDDVYGKQVVIDACNGIVNYFNGNFNKKFDVAINVENGIIRTNVKR